LIIGIALGVLLVGLVIVLLIRAAESIDRADAAPSWAR